VRAIDAGLTGRQRDLRLSREIKRLSRFDGLIIDDLGYLQQSRDDMEVVHLVGGALRTWQRPDDQQSAVLQMGGIFKDAMMTASRHRPVGAP